MKAPSWTNEEKLILLENVKTFDDIVNKKFSSTVTKKQKEEAWQKMATNMEARVRQKESIQRQ